MLVRLVALAVALSPILGGAAGDVSPAQPAANLAPAQYELHIVCPAVDPLRFTTYSRPTCPVRMVDTGQMLGNPALAVDPFDGNNLAIAMIHGQVDGGGPDERSRTNLPFTTFNSIDAGATWDDAYFSAPSEIGDAYGIHAAVAVDPYGHVYVGSTYAIPNGDGFNYTIGAQKFADVSTVRRVQTGGDGSYNLVYVDPVFPGGQIRQTWYMFNPSTDNMTMAWFEDKGPNDASTGAIGIVWTGASENDTYLYQRESWAIRPCMGSTNPVLFRGWLYIGCQADPDQGPFRWHPETTRGQVELFRMHPDGGEPHYMGAAPILGGAPKLGVRSDGRLVLLSADVSEQGTLVLNGAFGRYSAEANRITWSAPGNYGPQVTPFNKDERIERANIQDLMYREYSGVVHIILRETIKPNGPELTVAGLNPTIRKCIVALDEDRGILAKHELDIGNPVNRTDPELNAESDLAYEDLSDDIHQNPAAPFTFKGKPLGDTYQREFFAVADYGQAIFAELVEVTDLRFVAPPIPIPPPVPIPAPAPAAAASTAASIAVATAFSGALALSLLAASRRNAMAARRKKKRKW